MTTARSIRTFGVLLALAVTVVAALSVTATASAGPDSKCGKQVLDDWYDNGRIDRLYPLNCYEEAIDGIPSDIGPYVNAEEVITRALQGALRGEVSEGGCDPSADGSPDDCTGASGTGNGKGPGDGGDGSDGGDQQAQETTPGIDTTSTSSVPIPLLVLGGMSLLLLAAGAAGYLSRRRQAVRADDAGDSGNPPL